MVVRMAGSGPVDTAALNSVKAARTAAAARWEARWEEWFFTRR